MARTALHILIERLTEKMVPVVRNAFRAAIADVVDNVILADLIKAIEANDYQRAFKVLGMSDAAMRPLTAVLATVLEQGGNTVASTFPIVPIHGVRGIFRFDVRNTQAEEWLRSQSSSLITNIQEDTRIAVMNTLQSGMQEGNNPRSTALDIVGYVNTATGHREGGLVGLDQRQELYARNARHDLMTGDYSNYLNRELRDKRFDSVIRQALKDGKPLTKDQIDKLVNRYKDNLLRQRGERIARTESIQGLNRSQFEAMRQANEQGAIKVKDTFKEWDSAGDTRVRHSHRAMNGQRVRIDEPFTTPDGEKLMHPGDITLGASAKEIINCRCRIKWKLDFLSDID